MLGCGLFGRGSLLLACAAAGNDALHGFDHLVVVEGLGDIVDGAQLHGVDGRAQAGVAGHDQHRCVGGTANQFGAGFAWQAQVADDEIKVVEVVAFAGLADRSGFRYLVVVALQQPLECRADDGFVFNNQNI